MPHRAFRILVAALLVGCSYASHIEYDATHSCFPACETDFPTACGWKSDGCSEQCSQECGFTGDTGEPRQAPTGLTTHTYQLVPGEEETTTETYNCTRCSVTCGTSTGCPAGFVFYALGQSQTPKACRLLQDRDYAITKSKVAGCAGCCLSSATSASVSAAPAPSAQCSDFRDYSATPLTAGDYLNGRPFADAAAWIAHHASCNQSAAGSICPAFCITNGGCRTPCKSPGSDTTPTCPNDGMGGAAGSKCRAGMSCAWEYLFPTGVQVPAPSTIDGQFEKVPRTTIIMPMCLQIGPGCYKEAAGNEPCTPCGVGKYTDQVSCPASEAIKKACNPHTPGYTDASACKDCPAGTFSPVAINRVPGKCRLCPLGKYQAKTGQSQCTSCPAGKNTTSEGAVAESACADTNSPSAPNNTTHFVTLTVTLPYTKAEFDAAKQNKYKAALASAAGTKDANVNILSINEVRRRAGSVRVETKIWAIDAKGLDKLIGELGTGTALKVLIDAKLKEQGLKESTGVTDPAKAGLSGAPITLSLVWVLVCAAHTFALGLVWS